MEDSVYRTSTQYRIWSYTAETLASMRAKTNARAASRVKAAIRRSRLERDSKEMKDESVQQSISEAEVDCLTVEEERKILDYYCTATMQLADTCEFPTNVKATAVQYLKRFYLFNSIMTYHPKQMIASALFLSTKTENHYISLKAFVANMSNSAETTEEDVIAPEFLLSQGLRFTFDIRHPQRGLEGGFMELLAMSTGSHKPAPGCQDTARSLQQRMLRLEQEVGGPPQPSTPQLLKTRIQMAHGRTKEMLKTSALLTDAYFHYTPSQIWLAAFWLADEPLTYFYLSTKFPERVPSKLLETLESCADLLSSSPALVASLEEKKELKRIDKKLYKCRNPEKMDLIGINKAQKRDDKMKNDLGVDEKVIKKRKTEKDNSLTHMEDPFGPALKS